MQTIGLTFRPEVPRARREAVLDAMRRAPGVVNAAFLKEGSQHPAIARMAYISLAAKADVEGLLSRARGLPEIETASLQPQRRLV
jgi:hypothetical protein